MLIEQPPIFYRLLFPNSVWRLRVPDKKTVYLTFDDGPIPEVTPWVLSVLNKYNVKATFFCVGDNVRKYRYIYDQLINEGHRTGNHTFHHMQGWLNSPVKFLDDTKEADILIKSPLFRPPHGHMIFPQPGLLKKNGYKIIMWDVVTRDYSKYMNPEQVLENVKKYTRDGSVIVFHDSLKAEKNLRYALPLAIEWLHEQGYSFELIPFNL
ncbi:MAG: polysaccharide deacetylase family protein [Fermentimonas sp.]|nr:polysaccharide deacetylase family protein [Fermentimonas sp.]MDD4009658.1 polysaccharide deacetylase family protein [Fermentimonas sp.]MDD4696101.1 polysaccharide deacetylase family protein [Fermentimonas sp.]